MLRQLILVLILILTIVESRTTPKRRNFSIRLRQRAHNVKSPNSIKLHDAYGAKLHAKGESVLYEVKISLGETLQTIPVTISTTFSGLWVPQRVSYFIFGSSNLKYFRDVPIRLKTAVFVPIKGPTIQIYQKYHEKLEMGLNMIECKLEILEWIHLL